MKVSDIVRRSGIPAHVVRYYTRVGLLRPAREESNGYRIFTQGDVSRLHFIRLAKNLGYTLQEIGQILHDAEQGTSPCPRVRRIIELRIGENGRRLEELNGLQHRMVRALAKWRTMPDGVPDGDRVCELIESTAEP
jgi:DNA-binding transcriptional MerR regulator